MFLEYIGIIIGLIALLISIGNLVLYYKQYKRTVSAAIKHELKNLPPYKEETDFTTITVKNVGTADAKIESTYLSFSWDKDLIVDLDWEFDEYEEIVLGPNEEQTFQKRLPQPHEKGDHVITITTEFDGWDKKDKIRIRIS